MQRVVEAPSIAPGSPKLSIDEFERLPNDGKRYQLFDGGLDVTPAPNTRHQRISRKLQRVLMEALEDTGRGEVFDAPVDVVFDRHTIVEPDLVYVSTERAAIIGSKAIEGAPDLIVEILSPSTRRTDVVVKSELYARFGVRWYLIVDPDLDRIELHRLAKATYEHVRTAQSPETLVVDGLEGVSIPLARVFG